MSNTLITQLRDNPRLRWGIVLIAGIFWLYGILLLRETLQEKNQQYNAAAQSVARLRTQLTQKEWLTRVAPAKAMAVQLEGKLWQAPTSGLAQAAFQDALNTVMAKAGVTHPQITVTVMDEIADSAAIAKSPEPNQEAGAGTSADAVTPADLWKIKAKLGFDFNAATMLAYMKQIENNDQQIVVGMFSIRKEPTPHVEMELYGYFQKQAQHSTKPVETSAPVKDALAKPALTPQALTK